MSNDLFLPLEWLLKQLLTLIELTRDIERNHSDTLFAAQADREISYVFDENVFEMFVKPLHMNHLASIFYGDNWKKRPDLKGWAEIGAQSALVCSELLFCGSLPGQRAREIYLTEWHQEELGRRVEVMRDDISDALADMSQIDELIEALRTRALLPTVTDLQSLESISQDRYLKRDLTTLSNRLGGRQNDLLRLAIARVAARVLAVDDIFEPTQQILRLVSRRDIGGRLALATKLRQPRGAEKAKIDEDAKAWFDRLSAESELLLKADENYSRRRDRLIWNDANSLAQVRWLATRSGQLNHRVVMVTGDNLMFNTYRRWHSNLKPDDPEYFEPFFLRRPVQYSPLLNMNDSSSDITNAQGLLVQTRDAIEAILLPVSFAKIAYNTMHPDEGGDTGKSEANDQKVRSRERFCLSLQYKPSLAEVPEISSLMTEITKGWLSEHRKRLHELNERWRTAERTIIGSMYELISERMDENQRNRAESFTADGVEINGALLKEYLGNVLGEIVDASVDIWLPVADSFIIREVNRSSIILAEIRARPAVAVRLAVSRDGQRYSDLTDLMEGYLSGDKTCRERLVHRDGRRTNPALLFGVAATLALTLSDWSNAERFADLAFRTETGGIDKAPQSHDAFEFQYLCAVVKRYRMAEVGAPSSALAEAVVVSNYDVGLRLLDACEKYHAQFSHDVEQRLCLLRTVSERCALHLFRAAALYFSPGFTQHNERSKDVGFFNAILALAIEGLQCCFELEANLLADDLLTDEHKKFMERLSRQYLVNVTGADLLLRSYARESGHHLNLLRELPLLDIPRLRAFADASMDSLPLLVKAEVYLYLVRYDRGTKKFSDRLEKITKLDPSSFPLSLDRKLLPCIQNLYWDL